MELGGDHAGKQRPHAAARDKGFSHAPHPNIYVGGRTVQLQQAAGQVAVVQDLSELGLVAGLGQVTELAPCAVTLEEVNIKKRRV